MDDNKNAHIIELLEQNELALMRLYTNYAKLYPKYKKFWTKIAEDEAVHAKILHDLRGHIKHRSLSVNSSKFNEQAIINSIKYLDDELTAEKEDRKDPLDAFTTASIIETSMLENNFFQAFEVLPKDLMESCMKLIRETECHKIAVTRKVEELSKKQS